MAYAPRHAEADDPRSRAEIIARELAVTHATQSPDVIAAELRRRLTDAGLRPVGDDFLRLVATVSNAPTP
jgi:hypothetical protein